MSKNPVIYSNGTKSWHNKEGQFHRENGPAIEEANGSKSWYLNGQLHREDGPAIERPDGDNGPAIERPDGSKFWYLNGQLHREDGPACEWADGSKFWYLNNKELEEDLHKRLTRSPLDLLPLYLGQGFDEYIGKRLRDE